MSELATAPAEGTGSASSETKANDFALLDDASFAREMGLTPAAEKKSPATEKPSERPRPDPTDDEPTEDPDEESTERSEDPDQELTEEGGEGAEHEDGEQEKPAEPERKLATPFTLRQGEEEVEIPTDLMIEFDRHGKPVSMPLDKVVRLAKDGFHNRELQVQAERVPDLEKDLEILEDRAGQLTSTLKRLLTDPEYLEQTLEKYAAANTPEARASRAEQALEQERVERQVLQDRQEFSAFVRDDVQSALAEALEAAPDIDPEEVTDWVTREIRTFQTTRNAPPPRRAFREILKVVREEIVPRIAKEQARIAEVREARELKAKQGKVAEKTKRAKVLAAGAVRPAGKGGGAPRPKAKEIVSMEDATADIIEGMFR